MNRVVQKYFTGCMIAMASGMMVSCFPEDDFQNIEIMAPPTQAALPLLNTNLALSDMITPGSNGGRLVEKADRSYSLFYNTGVQSSSIDEFFPPFPAQSYTKDFSLNLNAPTFSAHPAPITFKGTMPLALDALTLYKIACKQGELAISLRSSYQHNITAKAIFTDITDAQGKPLERTFDLMPWQGNYHIELVSLESYQFRIKDSQITYSLEIDIEGSGKPISSLDEINFQCEIEGVKFSYAEGNFSGIDVPVNADTLSIPLLANAVQGNIALNPSLKVSFSNSFGVQVVANLSEVYVEHKSETFVQLQDKGDTKFFSSQYQIPYPENRNEIAKKTQTVDRTNSNIKEAFAELPRGLAYHFGFSLNSTANDTSFVTDQSKISIDLETELPLEGRFAITLQDTMKVDFGSISDNLEELRMLIKTENTFPIDAGLQIYFLDKNEETIRDESGEPVGLFAGEARLLTAAPIINSSTGETKAIDVDMPLAATISNGKYKLLENTKSLLISVNLNSMSEQDNYIKLYAFYNIRFSMAMQVKSLPSK